jgi:DegV family protein with EDD domain
MDEWRFVSDSSCDLDPAEWDYAVPLGIAPMTVTMDGEEYPDVPGADVDGMVAKMAHSQSSCSACPSIESFAEQFRKAKNVICIAMTAKLSGTYNSAMQARSIVLEEDPTRRIYVLDSHSVAGTHVVLLDALRRLHESGLSFDEIVAGLEKKRDESRILFSLASFHNFIQNGRVSRTTGAIATALRIRPIASNSPAGELIMLEKPRGLDNALKRMVQMAGEIKDMAGQFVVINYVDTPADAERLKSMMLAAYPAIRAVHLVKCRILCAYYADRGGLLMSF